LGSPEGSLDQAYHWWTFVISDTWRFGKRQDLNLLPGGIASRKLFSFGNGRQAIETAGACFRCFFQMRVEIVE
jgi:hypothetical protein